MDVGHNNGILILHKSGKICVDTKTSFEINVETRFPDQYGMKTHYYSCETRHLLLRSHVNMTNNNRTFPTEIVKDFVYVGQILFHCNLEFTNVFEYSPESTRNPSITFSESR